MNSGADTHESQPQPPSAGAPAHGERRADVVRLLPVAVLVLSSDRYFRAAATMLLSRRGCSVLSAADAREAQDQALLEAVDVLVVELAASPTDQLRGARSIAARIDGASSAAGRRVAPVGVVVVGEPEDLGETADAAAGVEQPVLDKWGPFERLYQAITDRDRARRLPPAAGAGAWPASLRRPSTG
jgi:CheY-like chemotaxis protein